MYCQNAWFVFSLQLESVLQQIPNSSLSVFAEWVEWMAESLKARAVAYVHVESPVSGRDYLNVSASPLLYQAIFNATKRVWTLRCPLIKQNVLFAFYLFVRTSVNHSVYNRNLTTHKTSYKVLLFFSIIFFLFCQTIKLKSVQGPKKSGKRNKTSSKLIDCQVYDCNC